MREKPHRIATGALIQARDTGRILLLLRTHFVYNPNTWGLVAGAVEEGETVLEGLKREIEEEMQINPDIIDYEFTSKEYDEGRNTHFYYYKGFTDSEFLPKLDEENLDYGWFDKDDLPIPLYPDIESKISEI